MGYLSGSEEHFTHLKGAEECKVGPDNCTAKCATDFWAFASPATGHSHEYSAHVYGTATVAVVEQGAAPSAKPFFVYLAFANTHEPLEAPPGYLARYPEAMQCASRRMLGAMVTAMDEAMGNITDALHRTQQWDSTLIVWVSDNGGPDGVGQTGAKAATCAANNFPLRGGKGTAFQGGVRTAGFVAGGLVPPAARGTKYAGYIHVADWFATFATVAGIPGAAAADDGTAPRPSDSIDAWPGLTGAPGAAAHARAQIPLSISTFGGVYNHGVRVESGAIIIGELKYILGDVGPGKHFSPYYPNSTARPAADDPGCPPPGLPV